MLFSDLNLYAQFILIVLGALVLFPWIAIPAIAIYKTFQVRRLPSAKLAETPMSIDTIQGKLGLTMADGGEPAKSKKKN